ncbi:MAG: NAD(P)/FAD-dependent oxidoreductase [Lachnospiraceae bacterium]|nr:NAD(P)/FAD-dependent oxidoreductase [Lachnospiraceae bacterium]
MGAAQSEARPAASPPRDSRRAVVIGGGASGMAAAYAAAVRGLRVTLLEGNEKLGKKVYITGKGRCNLTNDCSVEDMLAHVVTNPKFLYGALYRFTKDDVRALLAAYRCPTVTERGNRVFPASSHSSDVIRAWEAALKDAGAEIRLNTRVTGIGTLDGRVVSVTAGKETFPCDAAVVATGGLSYPATGSTGDGYRFAEALGHTVKPCVPSLVPLKTRETFVRDLAGLTLKNIAVTFKAGEKALYSAFGDLLFTHTGVSGPVVLSASAYLAGKLADGLRPDLLIDLKPALDAEKLDERVLRDFDANRNRKLRNAVQGLLPSALVPEVLRQAGLDPELPVNSLPREGRKALVNALKGLKLTVAGTCGFTEAVITKGGIPVTEVNASTMESRIVKGLYFAGEILDTDALTGGFNLQIAWSTGYLAGSSV